MAAVPKHNIRAAINQVVCQPLDGRGGAPAPIGTPAVAGGAHTHWAGCRWLQLCRTAGGNSIAAPRLPREQPLPQFRQLPNPACRQLTSAHTPPAGQTQPPRVRRQLLPQRGRIIALRVNVVDARALMSGSPVLIVVCSAVRKRPLRVRPAAPAVGAPPLAVATRKCGWQCSAELLARRNVRLFGSTHWQPHLKS